MCLACRSLLGSTIKSALLPEQFPSLTSQSGYIVAGAGELAGYMLVLHILDVAYEIAPVVLH